MIFICIIIKKDTHIHTYRYAKRVADIVRRCWNCLPMRDLAIRWTFNRLCSIFRRHSVKLFCINKKGNRIKEKKKRTRCFRTVTSIASDAIKTLSVTQLRAKRARSRKTLSPYALPLCVRYMYACTCVFLRVFSTCLRSPSGSRRTGYHTVIDNSTKVWEKKQRMIILNTLFVYLILFLFFLL